MNGNGVVAGLEQVRADLDAWRERRRKGDRIPEEVWRRAGRAVQQYGLNPVSRALRLDYNQLKRHVCRRTAVRPAAAVFVELPQGIREGAPCTEAGLACLVELEKGNGTRMRICVREASAVDWGKLKEAFLGA